MSPRPRFRSITYRLAGHALPDRHHGTVPVGRPALLSNTRQLCDAARHAGVAVYFAKIHFSPGYPEVSPLNKNGQGIKQLGLFVHDRISPELGSATTNR